jgi:hypothetical protein
MGVRHKAQYLTKYLAFVDVDAMQRRVYGERQGNHGLPRLQDQVCGFPSGETIT